MIRRPSTGMFCFVEILEKELVMKIKVGDKIDEIELPDTNGNMFKLSSTKGKKVLLTFYRIAGCSFCNLRLMEFKKNLMSLEKILFTSGFFIHQLII